MRDVHRRLIMPSLLLTFGTICGHHWSVEGFTPPLVVEEELFARQRPRPTTWRGHEIVPWSQRARRRRLLMAGDKKGSGSYKLIASNKKAKRDYEIMETLEAGVELLGSEVKSCRMSRISMDEGYAQAKDGQCFLHGVHIAECSTTNRFDQHQPKRPRRLLLHKKEIQKLENKVGQKGLTVVPLKLYFNRNNMIKVEIALAQGKNLRDKREDIKQRESKRDLERIMKGAY